MDDDRIIALYFQRNEDAIAETRRKYDGYCTTIAYRVLASCEDAQECVSDAYLKVWNAIPPTRPESLRGFLGRITHNLALDRYRQRKSRKHSVFSQALEEFEIPVLEEPGAALERHKPHMSYVPVQPKLVRARLQFLKQQLLAQLVGLLVEMVHDIKLVITTERLAKRDKTP